MYASTPASASASRNAAASPPGKVGASQPCGSPRKNWTMSAPVACTTANGSPSRSCAPMRTIGPSLATIRGHPGPAPYPARDSRRPALPRAARAQGRAAPGRAPPRRWVRDGWPWPWSGEGSAVSEGQHEPDEGGDQAGDDDDPLLARGGDQLGV